MDSERLFDLTTLWCTYREEVHSARDARPLAVSAPTHRPAPLALPEDILEAAGLTALRCPLTGRPFRDPVVLLEDGRTYERRALEARLAAGLLSPTDRRGEARATVVPAWSMRRLLAEVAAGAPPTLPSCPVGGAPLSAPLVLGDGHTYSAETCHRWALARWRDGGATLTSPATALPVDLSSWAPDRAMAVLADELHLASSPAYAAYPAYLAAGVGDEASPSPAPGDGPPHPSGTKHLLPAAAHGRADRVRLLAAAAGDALDAEDGAGCTALFHAVAGGHLVAARALLAAGAAVDRPSTSLAMTPLMEAARRGDVPMVDLLLGHGANPWAASSGPFPTPLDPRPTLALEWTRSLEVRDRLSEAMLGGLGAEGLPDSGRSRGAAQAEAARRPWASWTERTARPTGA